VKGLLTVRHGAEVLRPVFRLRSGLLDPLMCVVKISFRRDAIRRKNGRLSNIGGFVNIVAVHIHIRDKSPRSELPLERKSLLLGHGAIRLACGTPA